MQIPPSNADKLKALADAYAAEIAGRADEIEALRHLPQDLADRMAGDGLYGICTPTDHGGQGQPPRLYAEIVERLARADASAAWCVFIGITTAFSMASARSDEIRRLLERPGTIAAGVFAPNGRATRTMRDGVEGYVVRGRWQWGSGSRNAHWISGGALVTDAEGRILKDDKGRPEHLTVFFDASDITFLDTWSVMGLQGTGSTDFEAENVFVPAGMTMRFGTGKGAEPIFLFPSFGILGIGIAAVALGTARAAVDDLLAFAGRKVPQGHSRTLAEKPGTQQGIARAEAELRAARAFFYEAIDTAWAGACRGEVTVEHRRDLRLATSHAVAGAKRCLDAIFELAGGTAVYRTSPLQRRFRDIHVAGQHMMVGPGTYELVGRLLLDLPSDIEQL